VAPAVTELGLTVVRADELATPGSIMEQIRVAIQQARICIADLTGSNSNVMYELGLAQAAGKPTILISQDLSKVPFDIRSHRIIKYDASSPQDSYAIMKESVKAALSNHNIRGAETLMASGHNRAAILEAYIVLEAALRNVANKKGIAIDFHQPVIAVVKQLAGSKLLSRQQSSHLISIMQIRNKAVHLSDPPTEADAKIVVDAAKWFLNQFDTGK
jgi:nucleoside 2-deoxyribosyltransferase